MVVYGDLLFLINFSMDFLCFYLTCLLLHTKIPTFRVCIASIIGGVYSVASLLLAQGTKNGIFIDILVLTFMCLIVFLKNGIKFLKIIKYTITYLFVSALLGGIMTALYNIFNKMDILSSAENVKEGLDVWVFSLLAILGAIFTTNGGRFFRTSSIKKDAFLEIEGESGSVKLRALVDSGNLVHEPISGKSVVFASLNSCKNALNDDVYRAILLSFDLQKLPLDLSIPIRFVPSKMISGKVLLPALKFRRVVLIYGKERREIDVYIAFLRDEIIDGYDAIISNEVII